VTGRVLAFSTRQSTKLSATPETASQCFDGLQRPERWGGYGYLGSRWTSLQDEVGRTKGPQTAEGEIVARVDAAVVGFAAAEGWSDEELFQWADSKDGRWFADQTLSPNPDGLGRALREGLFNKQPLSADPPSRRERDTGLNQGHP